MNTPPDTNNLRPQPPATRPILDLSELRLQGPPRSTEPDSWGTGWDAALDAVEAIIAPPITDPDGERFPDCPRAVHSPLDCPGDGPEDHRPVHFSPYGSGTTSCGLPKLRDWHFITDRRDLTTCAACREAFSPAPVSDTRREDAAREIGAHEHVYGGKCRCGHRAETMAEHDLHAADAVLAALPAPPDAARVIEIVLEHDPYLDETACYDGGCMCPWNGTEREHEAHRLAAVAEALALPAPPVVDEAEVRERIAQDIEADRTPAPWGEGRREESVGHWLDSRDATKAARIARGATRG